MCGRYYLEESIEMKPFIEKMLLSPLVHRLSDTDGVRSSGEISPTDIVPVIAPDRSGKQSVFPMKWGYTVNQRILINARVETAGEKPTFRNDWKSHRCIVPASYYFEWEHVHLSSKKTKTGKKYAIQPKSSAVTWLCGLYRIENNLPRFVILTRDASDDIRSIHDRMPLIMPEELVNDWINPDSDPDMLTEQALTEMVAKDCSRSQTSADTDHR